MNNGEKLVNELDLSQIKELIKQEKAYSLEIETTVNSNLKDIVNYKFFVVGKSLYADVKNNNQKCFKVLSIDIVTDEKNSQNCDLNIKFIDKNQNEAFSSYIDCSYKSAVKEMKNLVIKNTDFFVTENKGIFNPDYFSAVKKNFHGQKMLDDFGQTPPNRPTPPQRPVRRTQTTLKQNGEMAKKVIVPPTKSEFDNIEKEQNGRTIAQSQSHINFLEEATEQAKNLYNKTNIQENSSDKNPGIALDLEKEISSENSQIKKNQVDDNSGSATSINEKSSDFSPKNNIDWIDNEPMLNEQNLTPNKKTDTDTTQSSEKIKDDVTLEDLFEESLTKPEKQQKPDDASKNNSSSENKNNKPNIDIAKTPENKVSQIAEPNLGKAKQEKVEEPVASNQIQEKLPAKEKKPAKKSEIKLWKDTFKDMTTKGVQAVGIGVVVMVLMGAFAPVAIPFALVFGVLLMGYSGNLIGSLEKIAKGIGGFIANHNERKAMKKELEEIQEANPNILFKKNTRKENKKAKKAEKAKKKALKKEAKQQKRSIKKQNYKQKQQLKIDKKEQGNAVQTSSKTIKNEIIDKTYSAEEIQKFDEEYKKAHQGTQQKNQQEMQQENIGETQKRGDFILAGENENTLQRTYVDKGKQGVFIDKNGYPQIRMPAKHTDITSKNLDQTPSSYDEYFDSLNANPKNIDFDSLIKTATKKNDQKKNIDLGPTM